jgi:hypothetical protein
VTQSPEVLAYIASVRAAETQLAESLRALRDAARSVNDLGALASSMQRAAQDIEYAPISDELRSFLDGSYIQRTGFVNQMAAKMAEQMRLLSRGVMDLASDGEKAIAIVEAR